ncbi:MAG: hypothetical protein EBZ84_12775 [Betaproteobacteria bacterium]|nr:hypothetical protein [Betaproteobacteria bacterium]
MTHIAKMDKVLLNTENHQVRAFLRGLWQKIQRYGKMLAAVTRHIVEILSACSFSITQHVAQAYTHRKNHSLHTFDYVAFQRGKTISHNPLVRSSTLRGGTIDSQAVGTIGRRLGAPGDDPFVASWG